MESIQIDITQISSILSMKMANQKKSFLISKKLLWIQKMTPNLLITFR